MVEREDLLKAVRLSALIASSAANVVRLRVGEEGSAGITIAANADVGEAEGQVEATLEGDPVTIAFNARYLAEALQNMVGDQLALEFSGPLSPGVLKPIADPDYVHVIMPVRTTVLTPARRAPRAPRGRAGPPSVAPRFPQLRRNSTWSSPAGRRSSPAGTRRARPTSSRHSSC